MVHQDHAFREFYTWQFAALVDFHMFDEGTIEKVAHFNDPLTHMIHGERFQIEIDSVGEKEVCWTPLKYEGHEFLVNKVLLQHHVGDDLWNVVFKIVPVLAAHDHRINAFISK